MQALKNHNPTVIIEPRRSYEHDSDLGIIHKDAKISIVAIGDTIVDAMQASERLGEMGIAADAWPWWNLNMDMPRSLEYAPVLTVDICPRRPEPGLVAPPFIPQGVSQPFERAWYPTSHDIVLEACRMLGATPPAEEVSHEQFAPAGGPF